MTHRSVVVKHMPEEGGWRLLWSDTWEFADDRVFATLEETGPIVRALMGASDPEPKLRLVMPSEDPDGSAA